MVPKAKGQMEGKEKKTSIGEVVLAVLLMFAVYVIFSGYLMLKEERDTNTRLRDENNSLRSSVCYYQTNQQRFTEKVNSIDSTMKGVSDSLLKYFTKINIKP